MTATCYHLLSLTASNVVVTGVSKNVTQPPLVNSPPPPTLFPSLVVITDPSYREPLVPGLGSEYAPLFRGEHFAERIPRAPLISRETCLPVHPLLTCAKRIHPLTLTSRQVTSWLVSIIFWGLDGLWGMLPHLLVGRCVLLGGFHVFVTRAIVANRFDGGFTSHFVVLLVLEARCLHEVQKLKSP